MVREESDFPVHGVRDSVYILPGRHDHGLIAEVNALAVALVLHVEFLWLSIARRFHNLEMNRVTVAQRIFVTRGKVAVNAVMDLYAQAAHANRLSNQQGGVLLHPDVAVVVQNLFGCGRVHLRLRACRKRRAKQK
jgi:hypothetical protein